MKVRAFFLLFSIFLLSCNRNNNESNINPQSNSLVAESKINDSIFYSSEDSEKNRILLFQKKKFVWIIEKTSNNDTLLDVIYGKYESKNDSILFSLADSTDKETIYPTEQSDSIFENIFKRKRTIHTEITSVGKFYAIRQSGNLEFILNKKKYVLLKNNGNK
ncbi:MAG: hypothetical protein A3F72_07925 [Bacteroidetes bacterium RIFCSPLOWO2_12_FULL_35_15]|nr:MAG: hypothetical protein A3F72_07925 [Bacteroidetes bacterium RIFCSPLOWO2_12_FULL_35_15]